ncbi:MAG: RDD family protein [Candidatus Hatepunaea meridiana]|nr:RDD family protein [Candidatus Hatepunaea meridiana]
MHTYTTFWKRFVAGIIDLLFFGTTFSIMAYVLTLLIRPQSAGQVILIYLFLCLFCYILLEAFWFFFKATPGKLIFKIQIVDAASGGKPGIGKLLLRGILYPVSLLPAGFGFWWILIDSRRQAAHDKLSGIVVINKLKEDESLKDKIQASASELDLKRFTLMKIVIIVCAIFLLIVVPSFLYLLGTDVPITDEAHDWFYEDKKETIPVEENAFYLIAGFPVPADMDPIQTGVTWTEEENARIEMLKINPSQPLPGEKYQRILSYRR